jgi:hypothetical protein
MDPRPNRIVRRDFPRTEDGYDRAAVDTHLEAVAADVLSGSSGASGAEAAEAERELRAGGRALLEEISSMRGELRRLSVSLRQHAAAITEALEELDASAGPDPVGPHDPTDPPDPPDRAAATRADARLVALDMALGGSSREEIDRELAARFDLAARAALIDEVLAAIA